MIIVEIWPRLAIELFLMLSVSLTKHWIRMPMGMILRLLMMLLLITMGCWRWTLLPVTMMVWRRSMGLMMILPKHLVKLGAKWWYGVLMEWS